MVFANSKLFNLNNIFKKMKYEKSEFESFKDYITYSFQNYDTGLEIDTSIIRYAVNIIKHDDISSFNHESIPVNLDTLEQFFLMAKNSNKNVFYPGDLLGYPGVYLLYAYYNDYTSFPVAREYIYKLQNHNEFLKVMNIWEKENMDLSLKDRDELIGIIDVSERIKIYKEQINSRYKKAEKFINGRIKNTSVTGGILLANEDNLCVVCNKDFNKNIELENISFLGSKYGVQVTMEVCSSCKTNEKEDNLLLQFIFHQMDIKRILENNELTIEQIRLLSNDIVKYYLQADILKGCESSALNDTITAITPKGFILKLRLTSVSDYGYTIKSPEHIDLVRFDSAEHHCDKVEFMPHHVHNNLVDEDGIFKKFINRIRKNKKKRKKINAEINEALDITDSFLTGYLGLDYVSIKDKLKSFE